MDGGPQPIESVEATLCEQFNCLPSHLDDEETLRMLNIVYCRSVQSAFRALKAREPRSPGQRAVIGEILRAKAVRDKRNGQ